MSQSGRYLHDFLYYGFNADEAGRIVFEGLMPHLAGGKRTFTNFRFAQPGRSSYQHADTLFPGADFPFSYPVTSDPLTGRTDGLMARCLAAGNCPKIIKTDTELEFYQGRASLVATDTQGNALTMPDNVRLFLLSNLQHAAPANAKSEMTRTCMFPVEPALCRSAVARAAHRDGGLDHARCAAAREPLSEPRRRDAGRADGGRLSANSRRHPFRHDEPGGRAGRAHHAADARRRLSGVPAEDRRRRAQPRGDSPAVARGAGRHPHGLELPQGRFGEGELCDNTGSMIPFARTREERLKAGDPRLSLEERYRGSERADAMVRAARKLVEDRLLLEEDAKSFVSAVN